MRINEMGLLGPENPQLPRGFVDRGRTPETAENAKIGLWPAFVSFHPNLIRKGSVSKSHVNPRFSGFRSAEPFAPNLGRRAGMQLVVFPEAAVNSCTVCYWPQL
jgi:hypothetical protein